MKNDFTITIIDITDDKTFYVEDIESLVFFIKNSISVYRSEPHRYMFLRDTGGSVESLSVNI